MNDVSRTKYLAMESMSNSFNRLKHRQTELVKGSVNTCYLGSRNTDHTFTSK